LSAGCGRSSHPRRKNNGQGLKVISQHTGLSPQIPGHFILDTVIETPGRILSKSSNWLGGTVIYFQALAND
jgi:hypothetical protein